MQKYDELRAVEDFLRSKNYNRAWKKMKQIVIEMVDIGQQDEMTEIIRKYMFCLNKTSDQNRTRLFCNRLMKLALEKGLDLDAYVRQCQLLNTEITWHLNQYNSLLEQLYELHPTTALHIIVSIFETSNLSLLSHTPNEWQMAFYAAYSYSIQNDYESNIDALSSILQLWSEGVRGGRFRGKATVFPHVAQDYKEFSEQFYPNIRSLNFLFWVCDKVSLEHLDLSENENEVNFESTDFEEYRRYHLPGIREHARMQNAHRTLPEIAKKRFSWTIDEINYERIIKVKPSGNDFKLNISDSALITAFMRATENAFKSHLQIMDDTYITNLETVSVRGVNCFEMLIFYYCIQTIAILYHEANRHFRQTYKIEALAPYLVLDMKDISKIFSPILNSVFKRKVTNQDIKRYIALYTFGTDGLHDLYYKPLISFGGKIMIVPSVVLMNNFPKTFLHHLNKLGVTFDDRGDVFEEVTRERFAENGFKVFPGQMPYSYEFNGKRLNGDIDLVAQKDSYLFIGQLKNRLEPIEPRDHYNVESKIRKGVWQALESTNYISRNVEEFCKRFDISEEGFSNLTICPFVLMSCFYGSGDKRDGIPIVDTSALQKFFDGELRGYRGDQVYCRRIRQEGEVTPEDLFNFLHEPYFLKDDVYGVFLYSRYSYPIQSRYFKIGPKGSWIEQFDNSFVKEAIHNLGFPNINTPS